MQQHAQQVRWRQLEQEQNFIPVVNGDSDGFDLQHGVIVNSEEFRRRYYHAVEVRRHQALAQVHSRRSAEPSHFDEGPPSPRALVQRTIFQTATTSHNVYEYRGSLDRASDAVITSSVQLLLRERPDPSAMAKEGLDKGLIELAERSYRVHLSVLGRFESQLRTA